MPSETNTCIITGASGFVGGRLTRHLRANGWRVVEWTRSPAPGNDAVPFRLGQDLEPKLLNGSRALVHCAYDFAPRKWQDLAAINVAGSGKLFQAARAAGVERIIFISSLSAFPGCRSLYGKAKLEIENLAQSSGAWTIRPGLIYGDHPGGMFGRLIRQIASSRYVPILSGGAQTQYLLHEEDLGNLVLGLVEGRVAAIAEPVSAAHEQGLELKAILHQIAEALGKRVSFVPIPWQCVWLGLKTLELVEVRTNFKSDSLISIVYQNPKPSFALLQSLGFHCRPFRAEELTFVPAAY